LLKLPIVVILFCLAKFCLAEAPVRPLEVGDAFPQFTATDIYGKEVSIGKLKGKVVILSIGYFDQSKKQNEDNSAETKKRSDFYMANRDKGLEVIRISIKRGVPFFITKSFVESRARETCEKDKDPWTVIIDWDNSLGGLLKMTKEPLTFIIDKSGIIRYKKNGYLIVNNEVEGLVSRELAN
jgi:peroxiredoxin